MPMALTFNEIQFDIIDHEHQHWIRLAQIAEALGYGKRGSQIDTPSGVTQLRTLYARHADEFTDTMTALVKLPSEGGEQETRIFSLRGCHLLAMLARTPVAKAFRKWVLDVLDRLAQEEGRQPTADSSLTPDQQCTLQTLARIKVESLPEDRRKGSYPQIWSRFNNHFRIARYAQLPQSKMSEAIAYLVKMELKPKSLKEAPQQIIPEDMDGRRKRILNELRDLEDAASRLFNEVKLCLHPAGVSPFLTGDPLLVYQTLCRLNYLATSGIYSAREAIDSGWRIASLFPSR